MLEGPNLVWTSNICSVIYISQILSSGVDSEAFLIEKICNKRNNRDFKISRKLMSSERKK